MMLLTINTWWQALSGSEQLYWGIAIVATLLFVIQMALSFIGLDSELDLDLDDGDAGVGVFSIKGFISFFMFFGWGGVGALASGFRAPQALMIAFLIGFLAMIAVAYVFAKLLKLQESGTININNAIDKEGEVYLTIPPSKEGLGKIHIKIAGKLMEFDAVTTGHSLMNGTAVKVKKIDIDNVMLVEPIN